MNVLYDADVSIPEPIKEEVLERIEEIKKNEVVIA